jgi:very-short-patch-repair endonuclease
LDAFEAVSFMHQCWAGNYKGTPAEHAIEPAIAKLGVPYRIQHPLFLFPGGLKYFPDFVLPSIGVVLEVDDGSHDDEKKKGNDAVRTAALEKLGYCVVRCSNDDALRRPYETVKRLITADLLSRKGPGLPPPPRRRNANTSRVKRKK